MSDVDTQKGHLSICDFAELAQDCGSGLGDVKSWASCTDQKAWLWAACDPDILGDHMHDALSDFGATTAAGVQKQCAIGHDNSIFR